VLGDPWFAWLREISQFIVLVDEARDADDPPVNAADADRLIAEARTLLSPSEDGGSFHRRYYEAAAARSGRRPRPRRHDAGAGSTRS